MKLGITRMNINIKSSVYKELQAKAKELGFSLTDYVKILIMNDLKK